MMSEMKHRGIEAESLQETPPGKEGEEEPLEAAAGNFDLLVGQTLDLQRL